MRRWITPLLILLSLAGLALLILPPILARNALRLRIIALYDAVEQEDMSALEQFVLPGQQATARAAIDPVLAGHGRNIERMRIRSMERLGPDHYVVSGLLHVDDQIWGESLVEGRMSWVLENGQWYWSIQDSAGRPFALGSEGGWTKALDWLNLAQP